MIHVENLTKYYNDCCAVDQISFDINKGEIIGLLGPNGAGKTTIMRMLTCFLRPTSGNIHIKEFGIDSEPLQIKKLLGYLPESAPLYHDMLVFDYLDYVADIRKIPPKKKLVRIRNMADLCSLNDVMHKPIGELSKGYKQRVGLAYVMIDDPEILVLDEPTSGLDPNQIVEIRNIIKQIGKEKTIILSTHILSEAEATCDRVLIINAGKIVADGSTLSLMEKVSDNSFINLSLQNADRKSVEEKLGSLKQITGIAQISGNNKENNNDILKLKITCSSLSDCRADIYKQIKQTDWILLEMHQETKTLENLFRELTKEK